MVRGWMCAAALAGAAFAAPAAAQTLEPTELPGLCVTIDAAEGSISRPCNKSPEQTFTLPDETPGPIRYGEACLAPRGEGYYPQLFPETCDGSPAQTWTISGEGVIRNGAERCLALLGLSGMNGAMVYGAHCPTRVEAQSWTPKPVDQEIYDQVSGRIRWRAQPELCLSLIRSGSFVGLEACGENVRSEQVFSFDRHDPSQFRGFGGACLTANSAMGGVRLSDCRVSPSSTWMLQDGSLLSNGELSCAGAVREGERWVVRLQRCAVTPEQSWAFEAAVAAH